VVADRSIAPVVPGTPVMGVVLEERPIPPAPPAPAVPVKLPDHVKSINIQNDKAVVQLKNGNTETYLFSDPAQQKAFEKKYGKMPEPPPPPPTKKVTGSRIYEVKPDESLSTEKRVEIRGVNLGSDKLSGQIVYLVDGKRTSPEEVNKIAPAAISSINVVKDKQVLLTYGEAGKDGLIDITTKSAVEARKNGVIEVKGMDLNRTDASLNGPFSETNSLLSKTLQADPLIIWDGQEMSKAEMQKKSTNNLESVTVLKEKEATVLYGAKGKNGVIIIKSKKN
jgi:TonB-dependent SusC/RagA subfamily outer membrane receptor